MLMWLFFTSLVYAALGEVLTIDSELKCPSETMLLNGIASKSPFFGDALSTKCRDFEQKVHKDKTVVYQFDSPEEESEGISAISARCANEVDVILAFTLQMSYSGRVTKISIECAPLSDPDSIGETYDKTSEESKDTYVSCDESSAVTGIQVMDSSISGISRVVLTCIRLAKEE